MLTGNRQTPRSHIHFWLRPPWDGHSPWKIFQGPVPERCWEYFQYRLVVPTASLMQIFQSFGKATFELFGCWFQNGVVTPKPACCRANQGESKQGDVKQNVSKRFLNFVLKIQKNAHKSIENVIYVISKWFCIWKKFKFWWNYIFFTFLLFWVHFFTNLVYFVITNAQLSDKSAGKFKCCYFSLQMCGTWLPWSLYAGDTFHALGITKYDLVPKIDSFISVQQLKTQLQNR